MNESDPTKIDIDFDPEKQRMTGIARHGFTPFDVPYISHIKDNLWQGGCKNGLILPNFIEHLFSLYPWEKYTINHALKESHSIKMYDSLEQGFHQVEEIAKAVVDCCGSGPTLVHCQAGLNRSSLIAARALMLQGMDAKSSIQLIRARRSPACLCNKSFEKWLLSL